MEETEITKLLQDYKGPSGQRGWRCPDEIQFAAFVDQRLSDAARESLEAHVAECDFCLGQISFLVKSADWASAGEVPAHLLSRARKLVSQEHSSSVWGWRWTVATAAAACLVFAVLLGIVLQLRQSRKSADETLLAKNQPPQPAVSQFPSPAAAETPSALNNTPGTVRPESARPAHIASPGVRRPLELGARSPSVLFPTEGAMVSSGALVFRWVPINDVQFYRISVMTDAGELVFASQSEQAQIKLPADVKLKAGNKYFVQVTANMPQGNTIKSSVVGFRVSH
ncbi:MAG: hypothetical protein ABJB21_04620 [bacterium]